MLTKKDIVGGIKNTKLIELPMYGDEIAIRQISDFEYNNFISSYQDMGTFDMSSVMKGERKESKEDTTSFKTSLKQIEKRKYDAKVDLAVKVLDNEDNPEKFTRKDIEQLKPGALDLIIKEALSFSELDDIEELDKQIGQFREEK